MDAFGGDNEVVDEFLHLREDRLFVRKGGLGVVPVDRTGGQFVEDLAEDRNALADLLKPDEIAVVAVAHGADGHIEVVVLVIEIGVFLAKVVVHPAAPEVRAREAKGDGVLLRNHADFLATIDENAVASDEVVHILEGLREGLEEILEHGDERRGQVAGLAAHAGVARGETGAGELLDQVVDFLALGEGVEKHGGRAEIHA